MNRRMLRGIAWLLCALLAALPGEVAAEAPAVTEGETVLVIVTP